MFTSAKPISSSLQLYPFQFSHYEIIESQQSTKQSARWSRANEEMFYKLMEDIYSVSKCDYVVCTLSSSVSMKPSRRAAHSNRHTL